MGTSGTSIFDNDDAVDFISSLVEGHDAGLLRETLEQVANADEDEYVEAPAAVAALAAAEVVAAAFGSPADDLPDEALDWIDEKGEEIGRPLLLLARRAVSRVLADSELREQWEDASPEDYRAWREAVEDLEERLG